MMMPLPSSCQDDFRLEFFNYLNYRLDQIEQDTDMNSLEDITKSLFENRADIFGRLAHSLIEKNFAEHLNQEYHICPHCGRRLKALKKKVRREIETLIGAIELYRPYFYCKKCAKGFYPLDEALGLSMGVKQHDIQELEAWLASGSPYEEASETYNRCTGLQASAHHIHESTNFIAENLEILDVCPVKEKIEYQIDRLSEGKFRRPIMMIGIDGSHAPTRPEPSPRKGKRGKGDWKEVKGFRIYLLDAQRIIHLISWHQIQEDKQIASALSTIKDAGLIFEDKVRLCIVGDGAPWIENRGKEIFPQAKQVLDYYHCSEYLYEVAHAQYGKNNQRAQEWVESTITRLFCNQIEQILNEMNQMKPASEDAKEKIIKAVRYLSKRKEKVNFGAIKKGGYHIGSGAIESSNKFISNVRLKRSGAWWYPTNANNILKLRCAKYNGTFDRIIEHFKSKEKEQMTRNKISPKLKVVVDNQ